MGKKRIIASEGQVQGEIQAPKVKIFKKGVKRLVASGDIHIYSTYNNTIISVTDLRGQVIAWASAGNIGFSGTRKSTPYAATLAAKAAAEKAKKFGFSEARVFVKGIGPGREAAIRGLVSAGIELISIMDVTPIPHNGTRPPKPRRV